ncbi:MAG: ABC transporter substrate-binding protein [Euryarchaeota archaeon]|nr:ABC transporter substrate-binding protein [Euryarchaeota archaeon]
MKSDTISAKIVMTVLLLVLALPAAASDYTLNIFGNANEDDTINMQDVTYTELIILEYRDKTELSDAKHDNKINMQDVTQIELIILGKEKELTVLDDAERSVTLKMPLKRVILTRTGREEALVVIGVADKVVGIASSIPKSKPYVCEAGGLTDLPTVGDKPDWDYEKILALDPGIVFTPPSCMSTVVEKIGDDVPVVVLRVYKQGDMQWTTRGYKTLGLMFGKEEEAGEIINWIHKYEEIVKERTGDLTPEELPTFYIEAYDDWVTYGSDNYDGAVAAGCGGRNIIDDVELFTPGSWGEYVVDPEWLLKQNPDVIFQRVSPQSDLMTEDAAEARLEALIDRPGWENLDAVKGDRVYLYNNRIVFSAGFMLGSCYFAKCLQPDLFSDMDPMELCDEYWNTFIGMDFPEVSIYPEPD